MVVIAKVQFSSGRNQFVGLFNPEDKKNSADKKQLVTLPNGIEIVIPSSRANPTSAEIMAAIRNGGKLVEAEKEKKAVKKDSLAWIDKSRLVIENGLYVGDDILKSVEDFLPKTKAHLFELENETIEVKYYTGISLVFQKVAVKGQKSVQWLSFAKDDIVVDLNSNSIPKYDFNQKLKNLRGLGRSLKNISFKESNEIEGHSILRVPASDKLHDWIETEIKTKKWTIHEYQKEREQAKKAKNQENGVIYTDAA